MEKKKKRNIYLSVAGIFDVTGAILFFSFCDSVDKTLMILPTCFFMSGAILGLMAPDIDGKTN